MIRYTVIIFDLDGTLTKSKRPLDNETVRLFLKLLEEYKVAVVGGGKFDLFKRQLLNRLPHASKLLRNLFLFPTNGTECYQYRHGWKRTYSHVLEKRERAEISKAIKQSLEKTGFQKPKHAYGAIIEDRGTQVTFSALGQRAPLALKAKWNATNDNRKKIANMLKRYLPNYEIRLGGLTSIDVTPKGIDKAYALRKIQKKLGVQKKNMFFIGDAIYPGGNDYAVVKTRIHYKKVKGPRDTKKEIRRLIG